MTSIPVTSIGHIIDIGGTTCASRCAASAKPQACDECYLRKVRCDRRQPCRACLEARHPCTRNLKRKRKGPQKGAGSIHSKLRNRGELAASNTSQASCASPSTQNRDEDCFQASDISCKGISRNADKRGSFAVPLSDGKKFSLAASQKHGHLASSVDEVIQHVLTSTESPAADFPWASPISSITGFTESYAAAITPKGDSSSPEFASYGMGNPTNPLDQLSAPPSRIPLSVYCHYLNIYQERLYVIWPIVPYEDLISRLRQDEHDFESYALAASLCAAVIAQLKLPEHTTNDIDVTTSRDFEIETQRLRVLFDYRENITIASLLTSFFLHIYFANSKKIVTGGFFLRESIAYAQFLRLDWPPKSRSPRTERHQMRLRVYWVLFISERTYCVQNSLPATLQEIDQLPESRLDGSPDSTLLLSFIDLTRLFTYIEGPLGHSLQTGEDSTGAAYHEEKLSSIQERLCNSLISSEDIEEAQRVDFHATRNWIRSLLWQYAVSHFKISGYSTDKAFSVLLPTLIAKDMLSVFSTISVSSIRTHGYGMELKIFQIVDSLLDVIVCVPYAANPQMQHFSARDALHSLERLLLTVGGPDSLFLKNLHKRMAELDLHIPRHRSLRLPNPIAPLDEFARSSPSHESQSPDREDLSTFVGPVVPGEGYAF